MLGGFLGFAVVPMILASKWRPLSWFGVILVLSIILLAGTRTGLILAVLSTMVYVMVNRGTGFWQLALGFIVVSAAAYFGMGLMPSNEKVQQRFSTIGNIARGWILQGRVEIYQDSVGAILTNPLGSGLGATGISGRINVGGTEDQSVIGRCRLLGDRHPVWLAWSAAHYLCALAHVEGNGEAIPNRIEAYRGDARPSFHACLDPGLLWSPMPSRNSRFSGSYSAQRWTRKPSVFYCQAAIDAASQGSSKGASCSILDVGGPNISQHC